MSPAAAARIVAPLALVATVVAVAVALLSGTGSGETPMSTSTEQRADAPRRRSYRVRRDDSLAKIAARYDLTVQELTDLNPQVDPQSLQPGQRLRLRR